ncbi:MAG TPA: NnrS family protein [Steroidobacteraceae bacterium]|nr:NnrS family protein [Steroidobacteraceae bacterium]
MRFALFAYGFRPHFLLAGLAALLLIPAWALDISYGLPLGSDWPPTLWHAHEMLFGFIASAVAGFLLTAVPSWTGQKGFAGTPLVVLSALWLAARLMIASSSYWPRALTAAVDLSFLPALAALVARPLLRSKNRNTPLLAVLGLLWLTNLVFHVALIGSNAPLALHALLIGIDLMLLLVTVIGGRIVPAFTAAALRAQGLQNSVSPSPALTIAAVAGMAVVTVGDVFVPDSRLAGGLAAAAAAVQGWRFAQWGGSRTLRQPIVWILHAAYLWLPVGLALKAIALLTGAAFSAFWLHALTMGTLATMILAVMTRAALGHTGRPLVAHPVTVASYLLLLAAVLVRIFGLAALRVSYPIVIAAAAFLWTTAFLFFVLVYAPILCGPRVDGRAG